MTAPIIIEKETKREYAREIGKGSFGTVFKASCGNVPVALKVLSIEDNETLKEVLNEISVNKYLSEYPSCKDNIICLYDFIYNYHEETGTAHMLIIMEFFSGKDLGSFGPNEFSLGELINIFIKIAEAIKFIHDKSIVHRDIKPENILYNYKTKRLKIIDFGLACAVKNLRALGISSCKPEQVGSPIFMAPELWKDPIPLRRMAKDYILVDIYALGVTYYIMSNKGETPYEIEDLSVEDISDLVLTTNSRPSNSGNDRLDELIMKMISKDSNERPMMSYVIETLKSM